MFSLGGVYERGQKEQSSLLGVVRKELQVIGAIIAGFLVGGATNNGFAGIAAGVVWFLFVAANDRG